MKVDCVKLLKDLNEVFSGDTAAVSTWIIATNTYLNNRSPIQAIADGDSDKVLAVVDRLVSGAYV